MSEAPERRELLKRAFLRIEELEKELASRGTGAATQLAVVGLGCRFPGGANDPETFWQLLLSGFDATSEIPAERWDAAAYYDPVPGARGKMYTRRGAFLNVPIDRFDPEFFGIAPRESDDMDPQQRLLLEVVWEALERGGHSAARLDGSATGVFLGMSTHDWAHIQDRGTDTSYIDTYYGTGVSHSVAAGRIAYILGLRGPALTIDTACSSSLVAFHAACQSLRTGEVNMAIAAGVSLVLTPNGHVIASNGRMLARDGRCKTFDASADGYARGEGCGVVLLKRLEDAQRDGDRVLAVVLGSAINQDGRSAGLTAPNGRAQEDVIRTALAAARIEPGDVGFVEAHGTGTELGDPIEIQALGAVQGSRKNSAPLYVGSVKTNIGHLESAAGIAGVIKAVLALQNGVIPPHLHFHTPNPHIPWERLPIRIPAEAIQWPAGRRIAGVSSFGFSGTNSHVVLEAAPLQRAEQRPAGPSVLVLSARTPAALAELGARIAVRVAEDTQLDPHAVTATLAGGRSHWEHRAAAVVDTHADLLHALAAISAGRANLGGEVTTKRSPRIALLFTGQGSQRAGMGRELLAREPVFAAAIERCDSVLKPLLGRSIADLIGAEPNDAAAAAALQQTSVTQPALFALEWSLAELWRSWGVKPAIVMGHSVGEYAAACVAGIIPLEDALRLIAERGRLIGALPAGGAMAAVFAPEERVAELVRAAADRIAIAAVNSADNTVLSGDERALERALAVLRAEGVESRRLHVSHAFHSPLMEPVLSDFAAAAAKVSYGPPSVDFIANLTAAKVDSQMRWPQYWVKHLREPVRFKESLAALRRERATVFIEVGPAPVLLGLAAASSEQAETTLVASLSPGKDAVLSMREALARLYVAGVPVDWSRVDGGRGVPEALPTYPFQRTRHWLPARPVGSVRSRSQLHPLLGERRDSPRIRGLVFESVLTEADPPWVSDHRVFGRVVFPAAAFLELAGAAVSFAGQLKELHDIEIREPLILDRARTVQTLIDGENLEIVSRAANESEWRVHLQARVPNASAKGLWRAPRAEAATQTVDVERYLDRIRSGGVEYGNAFRSLQVLSRGERSARGELSGAMLGETERSAYALHPALLDAAFQVCGACFDTTDDAVFLPVGVKLFTVTEKARGSERLLVTAELVDASALAVRICNVAICGPDGETVARIEGLRFQRAVARESEVDRRARDWLYSVQWPEHKVPVVAGAGAERWCVVGSGSDATELAAMLEARGRPVDRRDLAAPFEDPAAWHGLVIVAPAGARLPDTGDAAILALRSLLEPVLRYAQHAAKASELRRFCILTRGACSIADTEAVDPAAAAVWGLGQALAAELSTTGCTRVDVARAEPLPANLADAFLSAGNEDRIAHRASGWHVARLVRSRLRSRKPLDDFPSGYQLEIAERGQLEQLQLIGAGPPAPLSANHVRMRVRATGMNFRDVLNALGMYPGDAGALGSECVGVVEQVGASVGDLAVGDEVMSITPRGFCSSVDTPAALTVRIPRGTTASGAATIPIAFLTADWALNELARLGAGERVLIHAAAGGVGMAAIQLARNRGAEIFATAGSDWKRAILRRMGVRHVYDSRSLAFRDEILRDTAGEGVDVVLNSLADQFIPASLDVLAPNGRFIEIGKTGVWDEGRVRSVRPGAAYHVVYLGDACQAEPERVRHRLIALCTAFERGELTPLPVRRFAIEDIGEAFRFMAQARHAGKVVVFDAQADADVGTEGAVWITGGLGGLGLATARDFARRGCKRIVLSGRSFASVSAELDQLRALGAEVLVLPCDVAQHASVAAARARIDELGWTIAHVVHAAGVLDDGVLAHQDWERFATVLAPKVAGALNLHLVTRDLALQSFVLYSAGAALLGSPGQSNYAAANAFLDGLAQLRRSEGLPALSVAWGPWGEVGMAARIGRDWSDRGLTAIPPDVGVAALRWLLRSDDAFGAVLPIDWKRFPAILPGGGVRPFFELVAIMSEMPGPEAAPARWVETLEQAPSRDRPALLERLLGVEVALVLGMDTGRPPSKRRGLTDLGVDSLMAVELANRIGARLGLKLPSTFVFEHSTIEVIAEHLLGTLQLAPPREATVEPVAASVSGQVAKVAEMSAEEASAALLDELDRIGY